MKQLKITLLLTAVAAGVSACVIAPPYAGYGYPSSAEVVVDTPPPPPYPEVVPVIPYPGAIWIGGFWGWSGGHHVWHPGHYEHGRPGYAYRQSGWHHGGDGRYHFDRGGWDRR